MQVIGCSQPRQKGPSRITFDVSWCEFFFQYAYFMEPVNLLGSCWRTRMLWFRALIEFTNTPAARSMRLSVCTGWSGRVSHVLCCLISMAFGCGLFSKMATGSDSRMACEPEKLVTINRKSNCAMHLRVRYNCSAFDLSHQLFPCGYLNGVRNGAYDATKQAVFKCRYTCCSCKRLFRFQASLSAMLSSAYCSGSAVLSLPGWLAKSPPGDSTR